MDHATARLLRMVGAELAAGAAALDALGAALGADPAAVTADLRRLQEFDALAQVQRELAVLLERLADGVAPGAAVAAVRLEALQLCLSVVRSSAAAARTGSPPEEVWA